ncbi:MAG: Lrp/AsnC family transcriptional regulator [Microbacterium sp.]
MSTPALDEIDRRLLHALQIEPRGTWAEFAPVVGVDAATLARRWARLSESGTAWVTGHSTRRQLAMLEVDCDLGRLGHVAETLQRDPHVATLDHVSGSRDLLALVHAPDLGRLSDYVVARLARIPGIRAVRTHLTVDLLVDAASWRLRALSPDEAARIRPPLPPRARARRDVPDDLRTALEDQLWQDGRMPISVIAHRTGFAPQRVADAISTLRHRGELRFRTDVARAESGWPVYTWYFIEAPAHVIEATREAIVAVPEVRLAMTSASRYNLILAVWLRQFSDVNRFEIALEKALQGARIADRSVVLRISKQMGRIVGVDTRAIGLAGDIVNPTILDRPLSAPDTAPDGD